MAKVETNYNSATSAAASITIGKATQATLTVNLSTTSAVYGQTGVTATASGGSGGGAVTYSAGGTACSIDSGTGGVTITSGTGTCSITANKAADANYNGATSAAASITIGKANQTIGPITFTPPTLDYGGTTGADATATSALQVAFSSTTGSVCTATGTNGATITALDVGTCTIAANQTGDANYNGAPQVTGNITVAGIPPVLTTPTTENVGANLATLVLQADSTGTGYFTLLSGSAVDCGTGAQVKAGTDSTDTAAPYHGSLPLTANTQARYTVRNLPESTTFTVCFTAANPVLQGTPKTVDVTTAAMVSYTPPGWGLVGNAGFSAGAAAGTVLAFAPDGTAYVAYQDFTQGNRATVKMYGADGWVPAGAAGLSAGAASYLSLAFAPDGTPYLAYKDGGTGNQATVMKLVGPNWVPVGGAGLSDGLADWTALAFAPDGSPYLAFADGSPSYGGNATVMRYDGSAWVGVGAQGFAGSASYLSLAFAPDGAPYLAFRNDSAASAAAVMTHDGSAWVDVGSDVSVGAVSFVSLAIAPSGTPYVAYRYAEASYGATVRSYIAGAWGPDGSPGFSGVGAADISLAIAPDGTRYVAYREISSSDKATVMKFGGSLTDWIVVGSAGFTAGTAAGTALAFAPDGTPYVAFQDGANANKASTMKLVEQGSITINTVPGGLSFTVDGISHTGSVGLLLSPGDHVIATTTPQSGTPPVTGTQYAFASWSDAGAMSHHINVVGGATASYTAVFNTRYQLTTAAAPASTGLIAPATGGWFAAGTTTPVTIYPVVGYAVASWTVNGTTTETAVNTQPVLMSGPMSVTATLAGAQPVLTAGVTSARTGTKPVRTWTLTLTNRTTATGPAPSPRFDSLTLTQTYPAGGPACTPVVGTLPTLTGPLAVGATLSGTVGIDFTGCTAGARFKATLRYSDGGRAAGLSTLNNQPQ